MRRFALILTLIFSLTLLISAQEEPVTTEEPGVEPVATQPPAEPTQQPSLFGDALVLLVNARNDLELLAGEMMGTARPEGWSGSLDVNNPQLPLLIRLDLEILMSSATGGVVPNGWFGAVAGSNFYIARDIRHDMELLADTSLGVGIRPQGWTGGEPIWRCGRATQTLVAMLQLGGLFAVTADPASPTYCQEAELEAVQFSELNLLSNASGQPIFNVATLTTLPGAVTVQTDFAVAFLDTGASLRVGGYP